ncbi:uncharacterized protein LOC126973125 [Leptidea sinapis]|uniref:uncharacterized protein LOC126973125 n=1 Tax=Leptidea sinapis TaxID=189913 RepID=UPI0021C39356|nr:uncharacterized protein LOC126973125 [Leptidea sinapis]
MVLLSPSIRGLRKLLAISENAGQHGLKYNVKKHKMMVFPAKKGLERIPMVFLDGVSIDRVDRFRFFGHILTENLCDSDDIERERRALAVRCNIFARRFAQCSPEAKLTLFRAYCKTARSSIRLQYNNVYRILMRLPKYCSASGMFADARVPDYFAVIRSRVAAFWSRIRESENEILSVCSEHPENPILHYWLSVHRDINQK